MVASDLDRQVAAPQESVALRWIYTGIGALAGLAGWAVIEAADKSLLDEKTAAVLMALLVTAFASFFAHAAYLRLPAAALRGLAHAVILAGLLALYLRRWNDLSEMFNAPGGALALLVLGFLPVPYSLAQATRGNWRDYPALFHYIWEILVRGAVALMFTGLVWAVIALSAMLLGIVGITLLQDLVTRSSVSIPLSAAVFGLALAVVQGAMREHLSPQLLLWLLRLLLPPVTVVAAIFVLAAALRGFDVGFGGMSPALTLLAMAMAGVTLITLTLDAAPAAASTSKTILWSARGMALLVPILAGLALWAIWLRISAEGLSPTRILALLLGLLVLAYGLSYAVAVLRGGLWQARIRAANPWLGAAVIGLALIWMTPLFPVEQASAKDQMARLLDGRKDPDSFSRYAFSALGRAGDAALLEVEAAAKAQGKDALLAVINESAVSSDGGAAVEAAQREALLQELELILPVQPASATGSRTALLYNLELWDLETIAEACNLPLVAGKRGCVMAVADLLPALPGEEAVVILRRGDGYQGFGISAPDGDGRSRYDLRRAGGGYTSGAVLGDLLRDWQDAPPPMTPLRLNQLGSGDDGIYVSP